MKKGLGQYDIEYASCQCFWGTDPGKYVRLLTNEIQRGRVLDLGAGEGKNAIYLAAQGFDVVAVECSALALRNFEARLSAEPVRTGGHIEIVHQDVMSFVPTVEFDAVVAYGLLHCLPSVQAVSAVTRVMRSCTRPGGLNVIATFTDELPVPKNQSYLEPTLLPVGKLEATYKEWEIVQHENDILEECHPTTLVVHTHSIARLLARKRKGAS